MIRRICLYGGPGAGKTVEAAKIFAAMKIQHRKIELVQEWIKMWAYEKKAPESFDQVYIFSKQQRAEDRVLRQHRVDYIVSDSPIFLSACYAKKFQTPGWRQLMELSDIFDEYFPPLHINVLRGSKPYDPEGRYQTEQQAHEIDAFVKQQLVETGKPFYSFETVEIDVLNSLLGIK